ncbi:branched-chain amino acid aminotransferase [Methylopila capsulata]|uniref:Probable branched-chain-amino-acid aminotransferase n=1 Tax=Methylopila capsulata TaxID=61654 RepID=A0A9W6MSM8_9HYPH|nr:aminotransferase class IV [Methylopila capsulata]MBM7852726.1 branched-chain amino acid aminotransferase [Methylopila capsulata]GLK56935.1 2-keto-4-methylthiobutyrate aminotransferase [Methylopila capsulata]
MPRLNGAAVGGVAPFDLADRGLTLGDGLFETIAVFGGRPAALEAHLDRMVQAAAEIRLPVDRAALAAEAAALAGEGGDAVVRLTVTRGAGARGLAIPQTCAPTVIAARTPFPWATLGAPIRLATVAVQRNPTSFASRAKTLSYLDSVLAYDEARSAGADDALMLNVHGRAASTSMANLFALFGRTLVTPPASEGVLPGIMRRLVLEIAPALDLTPQERPLPRADLGAADAVFATNSVRLVMPVTALDGVELAGETRLVTAVADAVREACGAPRNG